MVSGDIEIVQDDSADGQWLAARIWADATAERDNLPGPVPAEEKLPGIQRRLSSAAGSLHLARLRGDAAGFALTVTHDGVLELVYLAVAPGAWGSGVGRALLSYVDEHARRIGIGRLELWVIDDNERALQVYERSGWQRTEDLKTEGRLERRLVKELPDRVALLLPGLAYSAERPLLHFARAVFAAYGWTTREVRWPESPPRRDGQEFRLWFARQRSFVHGHLVQVLDRETAPRIALAGKSMGAFAAGLAADRGLPAIWLTPLLRDSGMAADLRRASAPFLLVGGGADPSWDGEVARSLGRSCYEASGADHGMETAGDPVRSAEILRDVTVAMAEFVKAL